MIFLRIVLLFFFALACGKISNTKTKQNEEIVKIDGSNIQGVYSGTLYAMNINTPIGNIGTAGVHRSYDTFKAYVKLYIGDQGVIHKQTIHLGSRCPDAGDDINGDGYVDLREAYFVVGDTVLPLDGDINSQAAGFGLWPQGNGMAGGYFYERTASFSSMFEDLRDVDNNSIDEMAKLPYDQGISFNNKVVLISGVGTSTRLPDSLDTMGGMELHKSLPIACGILKKSEHFPSELYDRSDPIINPGGPLKPPRITPRKPENREPDIHINPPPPDPQPPRSGGIRQRFRRWWRDTFGNGNNGGG
jgi:hypothetical protein